MAEARRPRADELAQATARPRESIYDSRIATARFALQHRMPILLPEPPKKRRQRAGPLRHGPDEAGARGRGYGFPSFWRRAAASTGRCAGGTMGFWPGTIRLQRDSNQRDADQRTADRKSTRLNSSHLGIS